MEMPWWQWRVRALGVAAMTKSKHATKRKPGGTSQQPTAAAQSSPPQRSNQNKSNPILPTPATGQSLTDDANVSVTAPVRPSACQPVRLSLLVSIVKLSRFCPYALSSIKAQNTGGAA
jgi:hypothetical protein